jgi:hypothetical protein
VRQQYVDLLLVTPTAARIAPWVSKLQAGTTTPVDLITTFMTSTAPVSEVHPVLRAYLACYRRVPNRSELSQQVTLRRSSGLRKVCEKLVGAAEFRSKNGSLDDTAYVRWVYRYAFGTTPASSRVTYWKGQLTAKLHTRGSLLAYFLMEPTSISRYRFEVPAGYLYVGLLRRAPTSSAWSKRVGQLRGGTPLRTLVAEFFGTAEYARRFS